MTGLDQALAEQAARPLHARVAGQVWRLPAAMPALVPLRLSSLEQPWSQAPAAAVLTVARALDPAATDAWVDAGVPVDRIRQVVSWAVTMLQVADPPGPAASGGEVPATTVLERWELLEADFLREYNLDLNAAIGSLTWRRFRALLAGLSARSAWAASIRTQPQRRKLTDPKAIERYFASIG